MSSRHGVIPMNLHHLLSVKMAKKWKCFDESDCTDESSWASVHVGNQSAHTHATFVIQKAWTLSKVGNTHSFRYFGSKPLNDDNVICNPFRGELMMIWKADKSWFLEYSSHFFLISGVQVVTITGPTHAKLVSLTSPCCSGWPCPMNTLKANNGPLNPGVGDERFFRFKRNAWNF